LSRCRCFPKISDILFNFTNNPLIWHTIYTSRNFSILVKKHNPNLISSFLRMKFNSKKSDSCASPARANFVLLLQGVNFLNFNISLDEVAERHFFVPDSFVCAKTCRMRLISSRLDVGGGGRVKLNVYL